MATVLVIEDNLSNRELATVLLERAGHVTLVAEDAKIGLSLALQKQPDLIVMDVQMPDIDGLTATRQLKCDPKTAGIPVLALTALAMPEDEIKIRNAGCDGYLKKPIRYQEFLAEIDRLLLKS